MLEVGSGFHPELSGRENVYLNGSILGMSSNEIDRKFDTIVDFAGVGEFIDQPVKNYSSGMYVRLGFSVAIHVEPDILLVDEILAVGDMQFQEKCREKFAEFKDQGRTIIVVSHGARRDAHASATRPRGSTTASWSRSVRPRRSSTTTSRPGTWPDRSPPAAPGTAAARSSSTGSSCSAGTARTPGSSRTGDQVTAAVALPGRLQGRTPGFRRVVDVARRVSTSGRITPGTPSTSRLRWTARAISTCVIPALPLMPGTFT